jgi:hypothetical protein
MAKKAFLSLCAAAPAVLFIACVVFPWSASASAVLAITGILLSVALLGWSLCNLVRHWRRSLLGFASLLVCLCSSGVVADYLAVYHKYHSQNGQPNAAASPPAVLTGGSNVLELKK